jgi:hypothetical protein
MLGKHNLLRIGETAADHILEDKTAEHGLTGADFGLQLILQITALTGTPLTAGAIMQVLAT